MLDWCGTAPASPKLAILLGILLLWSAAFAPALRGQDSLTAAAQANAPPQGSAERGKQLFGGTARFQNRGPACAECHSTAGLPFPNGGTLGPDLTGDYQRFGPDAMSVILQTLYFPTMNPIFANRPLAPAEQADLMAFFQQSGAGASPRVTGAIAGIAVLGVILLLASTGALWRRRLRYVRKPLVQAATGKGAGRA